MASKVEIINASNADLHVICDILAEAFCPYRKDYTEEAYRVTISSPQEISARIDSDLTDVIMAKYKGRIVGTATLHFKESGESYLSSMAVSPALQGKGVGYYLLKEVELRARRKNCTSISLECCEFLRMAIGLYKRMGYKRTGRKRPYFGIEVFEMQKRL